MEEGTGDRRAGGEGGGKGEGVERRGDDGLAKGMERTNGG